MSADAELRNGISTPAEAEQYLLIAGARLRREYERRGEHLGQLSAYLELTRDPVV